VNATIRKREASAIVQAWHESEAKSVKSAKRSALPDVLNKVQMEDTMKKFLMVFVLVLLSKAAFAVLPTSFTLQVNRTEPTLNQNMSSIQVFNKGTGVQLLDCKQNTCTVSVKSGTLIRLVGSGQNPFLGFSNWGRTNTGTGACVGSTNYICEFTVSADTAANAVFKRIEIVRVQLGTGDGLVRVKRNGAAVFDCTNRAPLSCSTGMLEGDKIRIEAIGTNLNQFQKFTNQTGDATVCTGQGATFFCEFTLTTASSQNGASLVANFIPIP